MKLSAIAVLILFAAFLLTSCSTNGAAPNSGDVQNTPAVSAAAVAYQKISADEAYRMISETEGYLILDVRTKDEFDQGHIENAVLLPVTEIAEKASEQIKDKDQVILVYCRSGRRSAQASQALADMGYANVYDFGGIIDWAHETVVGK